MASRTKKPVKTTIRAKAQAKVRAPARARPTAKKPIKQKIAAKSKSPVQPKNKLTAKKATKLKKTPPPKTSTKPKAPAKPKISAKSKPAPKPVAPRKPVAPKKAATTIAPNTSRETLTTLRAHVDAIEGRLKRANSLTKSSVKSMQTAFTKLNERSGQASAAQEKEIVEYVEALNVHLTGLIDKTREDVAHDLQVVLDDPRINTISDALTKANQRITRAESEQASALTSINEQIANLATVVDRRLRRETQERERAQHLISEKIESVEKSSAEAVSSIGEKIVTLTTDLNQRTEHSIASFRKELSASGHDHQKDISAHKSEIARRMEALEDDQRNSIPSIERRLVTITSRLEALESDHFNASTTTQMMVPAFEPAPQFEAMAARSAPSLDTDAFAPQPATAYADVTPPAQVVQLQSPQPIPMSEPAQNALLAQEPEPAPSLDEAPVASHIPQEYVPQEYAPPAPQYAAPIAAAAPGLYADPSLNQEVAPVMADPTALPGVLPPPPYATDIPLMPAPEQTMDEARPGGDIIPEKKRGFLKMLKGGASRTSLSGSPIKLFALMTGIAVIGLFAAQKIMPGPTGVTPHAESPNSITTAPAGSQISDNPVFASAEPTPPVIESMDVVGDYSNTMQAPEIEPESNGTPSIAQVTLESAAATGDMVAQFQLGLSHLEAGRNAEAVRLIRLSANQGQAAAQYRLAKLYENGIGVEKDLPTALKLLERSAKGGNRIAMHDLGHYYATGAATPQPEIDNAVTWFQMAAERGVLDSQFNLGVLYQEGSGVTKNPVDSYVWYAIAGAQGDPMAVQRAEVLEREMSQPQLEQAKSRVKAFVPTRINEAANGVFGNLPWANPAKPRTARVNTDILKTQELLANLGYQVGTPDGAMGPKTRNAIITFEKTNGLPETGLVSAELLDRLSLAAGV